MATLPSGPSANLQVNDSGDLTVTPSSQLHTEEIRFTGSARTTNITIGTDGLNSGGRIEILCDFTAVANSLILNLINSNGTTLFSFTKAGSEANGLFLIESTGYGGLKFKGAVVPAYVSS